ncbi:FAD-dependent oxidoreductase [Streptomyces sp. NPDC048291]|uniref:FAD-dependent oxidoreductase n=1 Tax=Streptomyces sp. NPDC048291 TaxID=3365530 RepID=UPI003713C50C
MTARPRHAREVRHWDGEADVVIVGYGVAGAAAAIGAAVEGVDVLLIEHAGGWGGAAVLAGGFVYLGGGTALQRACGFHDTPEAMYRFLEAAMGPAADTAKLAEYAEHSVEHFDWLTRCGVPFRAAFFDRPAWEPPGDEGLMYSGGENAHPFADIAPPAPRGHLPRMADKRTGERGAGYELMRHLAATAEESGARVRYHTRFQRLVVADGGRVSGVIARSLAEEVAIRARRGVVLAAGGFTYHADMVDRHVPVLRGRPGSAVEQHDGRAIRAAQAIGADVAHLWACEAAVHTDPGLMIRGIVVNARGERVINEDTYPGRIGQELLMHHASQGFVVIDEEGADAAAADRPTASMLPPPQPRWVGDDLAELEKAMEVPPGALAATVTLYNRHAADGRDPVHHKAAPWVRPLRPPYGVYDVRGQTSGFTLGGLRTDAGGAVLDVDGEAIAALYAAGRTAAGVAAGGYASGVSLGDGSFFGRRAGRAAARG